jgi:hypothetical protein
LSEVESRLGKRARVRQFGPEEPDPADYIPLEDDVEEAVAVGVDNPVGLALASGAATAYAAYKGRSYLAKAGKWAEKKGEAALQEAEAWFKHATGLKRKSGAADVTRTVSRKKGKSIGRGRTRKRPLPGGGHVLVGGARKKGKGGHYHTDTVWKAKDPLYSDKFWSKHAQKAADHYAKQLYGATGNRAAILKKLLFQQQKAAGSTLHHNITSIGYVPPGERMWWSSGGRVRTYGMYGKQKSAIERKYGRKPRYKYRPSKGSYGARGRRRSYTRTKQKFQSDHQIPYNKYYQV